MRNPVRLLLVLSSLLAAAAAAPAEVKLATVFSDHMVLQRGVALPVWGWATPGEAVSVTLGQVTKTTTTPASGRWEVRFDPLQPGPNALAMAVSSTNALLVKDILVGDVWFGSGQSNMDFTVAAEDRYWCGVYNEKAEVAAANYPEIRMFKVKLHMTDTAAPDVQGQWQVTTPETVKKYSAVGYFLSRELFEHLHVPIGFIDSSYGASTVEAWISPEAMQQHADYKYLLDNYAKQKAAWAPTAAARTAAFHKSQPEWAAQAAKDLSAGRFEPRNRVSLGDPTQNQHNPSVLFNGMIAPILGYPIKGAVWYQGESNEDKESVVIYRNMVQTMVQDWRTRWGKVSPESAEFPFLYVQLASLNAPALTPPDHAGIALLREQQRLNLDIPKSAMAVTIDIGDPANVHPKNKQELGRRLGLMARKAAYGEDVVASGPLYDSFRVDGSNVTVHFTHAEGGLASKGGAPVGFALAGADRKWYWADARIPKAAADKAAADKAGPDKAGPDKAGADTVILSSPSVPSPVAVRYAYADDPPGNLYGKNDANLPASPFRTDVW
ncbi:MAG: sialate O-acetylesterase [Acidobacteriota bacterium]|nr:sialate O-acetylesterase [Acidobacteriota bacterium]